VDGGHGIEQGVFFDIGDEVLAIACSASQGAEVTAAATPMHAPEAR